MTKEQLGTLLHDYGSLIKKYKVKDYTCSVSPWRYSDPLVQPNLEYIMELCNHYKIKIGLCTNGVSFTKKQCEILNKYIHLTGNLHMSVIGHTEEELWEFMKIKKTRTLESLKFVKDNYPELSKKIRIGIKHKVQSATASASTVAEYQNVILGKVKSKSNWVENRMGDGDGDWTKPYDAVINKNNYMQGCSMGSGRILRKMEVLVNGQAVLCCDDAEGKTNYGNIFEIGIEGAWKNMQKEHEIIYAKEYSDNKKNLICNTCSRAKFNDKWTPAMESRLQSEQQNTINRIGSMR